jgi:hypothetical protein
MDTALARRTELPPAIGRFAAILTATLTAGLVLSGWWAVFSWLLLLACVLSPWQMAKFGLTILACAAGISLGIAAVALFIWGMSAAPVVTIFVALMALSLVDRR